MDIYADLVYNHTGYYITSYFRSAFIGVRKKSGAQPIGGLLVLLSFNKPSGRGNL